MIIVTRDTDTRTRQMRSYTLFINQHLNMKKQEVEQILILVKSGQQHALHMKIYKNGILCRRGCGGLPEVGISAMSFTENATIFDKLMNIVPQELLDNPINYEDQKISTPLEYIIAFYGVSKNGETGENAEWTKSTGIRLLLDSNTAFRHTALSFADAFSLEAAELTNSWYFDAIIHAAYKLKSTALPEQTILTTPQTEKEIQKAYEHYVNQIRFSARKWDITTFGNDKMYLNSNNNQFAAFMVQNEETFSLRFIPMGSQTPANSTEGGDQNKWWKVW